MNKDLAAGWRDVGGRHANDADNMAKDIERDIALWEINTLLEVCVISVFLKLFIDKAT